MILSTAIVRYRRADGRSGVDRRMLEELKKLDAVLAITSC
jgi:hypothetical protein